MMTVFETSSGSVYYVHPDGKIMRKNPSKYGGRLDDEQWHKFAELDLVIDRSALIRWDESEIFDGNKHYYTTTSRVVKITETF